MLLCWPQNRKNGQHGLVQPDVQIWKSVSSLASKQQQISPPSFTIQSTRTTRKLPVMQACSCGFSHAQHDKDDCAETDRQREERLGNRLLCKDTQAVSHGARILTRSHSEAISSGSHTSWSSLSAPAAVAAPVCSGVEGASRPFLSFLALLLPGLAATAGAAARLAWLMPTRCCNISSRPTDRPLSCNRR